MHNTLQAGLHYKLAFYSDALPLGAAHIALFNEIVEVVRLDVSDRLTTPEQVSEMVHQIDLFLAETGATVAYVDADGFADALVDEFVFAGYDEDWTSTSNTMYKLLKT